MASIRLLLQIAVQYDLLIHHMVVKSAYSNAHLDYEIYVEPPEGFENKNGNNVWKLKKSLYGLKQSSWTWNKIFHTYLTTLNFILGKLSWFLGIQFEYENNTIKINQSRYIGKISKFGMADCKPRSTPCEMDMTKTNDKVDLIESKPYWAIIRSLIYIMVKQEQIFVLQVLGYLKT